MRGTKTCVATVLGLLLAQAAWAGPIQASLSRLDAQATAPAGPDSRGHAWDVRDWGLLLLGTGGALATASVVVSSENASACEAGTPGTGCGWYRFGRVVPWVGLTAAGAGAIMLMADRGRHAPSVTVQRGLVRVNVTRRF